MAKYGNSKRAVFYGKLANVIGSHWRGIDYLRSKPRKRKSSKRTPAQIESQTRFKLAVDVADIFHDLFDVGFMNEPGPNTGFNNGISYLLSFAIIGPASKPEVDYSRLIVCHGKLPNVEETSVQSKDDKLIFAWKDNSGIGKAKANDYALLACYCEEEKECIFTVGSANRSHCIAQLDVKSFAGRSVYTWLSFISKNGKATATSIFTGSLMV